jgi:hypothetical protein
MLRPAIFEGEFVRSYYGRVMRINGVPNPIDWPPHLSHLLRIPSSRRCPLMQRVATVAGIDCERLATRHSLMPYRRGVATILCGVRYGCETHGAIIMLFGMATARQGAYLCEECVATQYRDDGICRWQRDHQLPGRLCCAAHQRPLAWVQGPKAFNDSPAAFCSSARRLSTACVEEAIRSARVEEFLKLEALMMDRASPLNVHLATALVRRRAELLGLVATPSRFVDLSLPVQASYPQPWLSLLLPPPNPASRHPGRKNAKPWLCAAQCPLTAFLLVMGLLYDHADDAFDAITKAEVELGREGSPRPRKPGRPPKRAPGIPIDGTMPA